MSRQQRAFSSTGIYHIMLRGNERKNIFNERDDKQRFIETIAIKLEQMKFYLYAYCVMDNHVHILLNTGAEDLSLIMKGIAVRYAYFYNSKHQRVGHVFQDRYKSECVESEPYLLAVMRYIHNNPVKAGIVSQPQQYQWSSYNAYATLKEDKLVDTDFVLSLFSDNPQTAVKEFQHFSNESDYCGYLDDPEEDENCSLDNGRAYLDNYLERKYPGLTSVEALAKNSKEIIMDLRSNTRLSIRVIADMLGVNRNVVQRVRVDESKEPSP